MSTDKQSTPIRERKVVIRGASDKAIKDFMWKVRNWWGPKCEVTVEDYVDLNLQRALNEHLLGDKNEWEMKS